jgi:hypothetical protein
MPLLGLLARLVLAASTLAALWIGTRSVSDEAQRRVDRSLVVLALLALIAWMNWASPTRSSFVQTHSMFHYYLSSKYFHEIGYFNLYGAALIADAEDPPEYFYRVPVTRDLSSYELVRSEALRADRRYVERFTPARWAAFKADLRVFQVRLEPSRWSIPLRDHGNNGPPAQAALSGLIATLSGPATPVSLQLLALIDTLGVLALFYTVYRVSDLRTSALAVIFFGLNELCDFGFVAGGFMRLDWLVATGFGFCALKARRYALAGFCLGAATMLRVFPVLFAAAFVLHGLIEFARTRAWPKRLLPFCAGGALAVVCLFLLSLWPGSGLQPWFDFIEKIGMHHAVQASNLIGLRKIVDGGSVLLWVLRALLILLFLVSLPRVNELQASILGSFLVLGALTIADYYYGYLLIFALWQPWRRIDPRWLVLPGLLLLSVSIVPVACRATSVSYEFQFKAATASLLLTCVVLTALILSSASARGRPVPSSVRSTSTRHHPSSRTRFETGRSG